MSAIWPLITLSASGVALAAILWRLRGVGDRVTWFVCLALWLRFTLAALPQYTVAMPLPGGITMNAAGTLGVIALGLLIVPPRLVLLKALWPIWLYLAINVLAGMLNGQTGPLIRTLLDWTYMMVLALALYEAAMRHGTDTALRLAFPAFALPVFLGLASFAVGHGQFSEHDGSTSFRGGYLHESIFSVIVFTSLAVSLLIKWRQPWMRFGFTALALAAIFLANYRTVVLALLPVLAMLGLAAYRAVVAARFRPAGIVVLGLVALLGLGVLVNDPPARFADLAYVAELEGVSITQPEDLTRGERKLLSHRLYLWGIYMRDYVEADTVRWLMGFGPGAWTTKAHLTLHPHNNYILDLYSLGLIGLAALLLLYFTNLGRAMALRDPHYRVNLTALQLGFLIVNLATSPLNVLEGLILLGVLVAVTAAAATQDRRQALALQPPQPQTAQPWRRPTAMVRVSPQSAS